MQLGELGEQIVLKSEKAFRQIRYQGFEVAWADMYYHRKTQGQTLLQLAHVLNCRVEDLLR